jgi:thioesterase domain-containing protein
VSLVALDRSAADGTPVYLVHGVNGTVLPYRALVARLGAHRPCRGVEARGVDGEEEPLDCVEALAAAYIDEIRAAGEPRRWLLAGWSFGGLVAYEMAVQLGRAGHATCAALIDTQALVDPRRHRPPARRALAAEFDEHAAGARDRAALERLRAVYAAHVEAMLRYCPGRLRGPLAFLRADGSGCESRDPTLGFGELAGEVQAFAVAGDHASVLEPPQVDGVAARLSGFFDGFDPR